MKFQPVCNPTIRKNFQKYPVPLVIVNIFFLSPGLCTQDAISCTKQPHGIAWYTRGRSLFLYQPPITASLVRPKSFPCTKATLRCHLSTECHFRRTKQLLIKLYPPEGIFGRKKMSCNGQSTHNSHRATASKYLLPFAYGNAVKTSSLLC